MNHDARQIWTEWLVLKAQAGDERAFRDLYEVWAADLRRLARVQLEQVAIADEVAQDAWIAIARGLHRLDDPACFPRWAFRILDRRCADWIRRRETERRRTAELPPVDELIESTTPEGDETDDVLALRRAIARLDADARKLLHFYYELGMSVSEIAAVLDAPPGTIKSRLFSLRESLKRHIERIKS